MAQRFAALVARMHSEGGRSPAVHEALAALSADEVVEVLLDVGTPQCATYVAEAEGERLRPALERAAHERLLARYAQRGDAVVLGGLIGLHRLAKTALDARFDTLFERGLCDGYTREIIDLQRAALDALPEARREAIVLHGYRVHWDFISTCRTPRVIRAALEEITRYDREETLPGPLTPMVRALVEIGDRVVAPAREALRTCALAPARRVLVAVLSRVSPDVALLTACCADPDVWVRRLARDGIDAQRIETRALPAPVVALRAVRDAITASERTRVLRLAERAMGEARLQRVSWLEAWAEQQCALPDLSRDVLFAEVVIDHYRHSDPPMHVIEQALSAVWQRWSGDERTAWLVADLLCRVPPDPNRGSLMPFFMRNMAPALTQAVAPCLAALLGPETCGNPAVLYDWLATTAPRAPGAAECFERGLSDPDPRVKFVCAHALGRAPVATARWSATNLRAAFVPLAAFGRLGSVELFTVDYAARDWAYLSAYDEAAQVRCIESALFAWLAMGLSDPAKTWARWLASLRALGYSSELHGGASFEGGVKGLDREGVLRWFSVVQSNESWSTLQSEFNHARDGVLAVLSEAEFFEAPTVARGFMATGLFFRHPANRYAGMIAYLNDQ